MKLEDAGAQTCYTLGAVRRPAGTAALLGGLSRLPAMGMAQGQKLGLAKEGQSATVRSARIEGWECEYD